MSFIRDITQTLMEQLNRIEIRGHVGSVNIAKVGEGKVAHFSVVTNYVYKGRNGEPVIETTWHSVTAWEGRKIPNLDIVKKGAPMYVRGRMRQDKFTGSDGTEKTKTEIFADVVETVEESPGPAYGK